MPTNKPDEATRQLLRALIVTMNDVAALKMLFLAHFPGGYEQAREHLGMALDAASEQTKPFLDALDQADAQELFDMLGGWKGGMPH
jgi:hypothetical protein